MATWLTTHRTAEVPMWYKQSEKLRPRRVTELAGGTNKPPKFPLLGPLTFPLHRYFMLFGWFCSSLSLSLTHILKQTGQELKRRKAKRD